MKIAMSCYRFNLEGGIERASLELAHRLAQTGDEVTLLSQQATSPAVDALAWQRVTMSRHPAPLAPLLFSAAATRQLDASRFDVTHNQGGCALRRQDVITAHSCHRAWWEMKKRRGELARAYLNPLHHAVLRVERENYRPGRYAQVIAVSRGVGREVARHYGVPEDRITVVPNGVNAAQFAPLDAATIRARLRRQHGLADDDVVLLFVGKEFRRKGLGPVIEALPHLPATARLLVVGGDDRAPFEETATALGVRHRVTFVGHSDAVQDWFQAGDVFVFPTAYEAFALVTLEAAAAGLPLVTTEVNGTEDLVVDGVNGRFVTRAPESIARGLRPLVESRDVRRRLGEAARTAVRAYTWDAMTDRTREVYAEVTARRRAG